MSTPPSVYEFKFEHLPKTIELMSSPAPNKLSWGGIRSGKTQGTLMYGIFNYVLKYEKCDMLILRRNFRELESGAMKDFQELVPRHLYDNPPSKSNHICTFKNGSRVVFGHCLAKGTLITTLRGLVPIEWVTPQDFVLTRKGYRKVVNAGLSGFKPITQLGHLGLTLDHKVFTGQEFSTMRSIIDMGVSECLKDSEPTNRLLIHRPSYLRALSTAATLKQNAVPIESITEGGEEPSRPISIMPSGSPSTEKYLRGSKSTTRTKTPTIILSMAPTMSCCLSEPIGSITCQYGGFPSGTPALTAEKSSWLSSIREEESFAQIPIPPCTGTESEPQPVYDIEVEGEHEFFANGILVHNCANLKDRDIEQYLGSAYPFILLDECAQFSPEAWEMLSSRNTINPGCVPNPKASCGGCGHPEKCNHQCLPVPVIWGCTNPVGPYWDYYRTVFLDKLPWDAPEGAKKDARGYWWVNDYGEWQCVYNPDRYAAVHSTPLDNPHLLLRDPNFINKLKSLPKAMQDKMLYGIAGKIEGQYFDCFSENDHVLDLKSDPECIVWQPHQDVWCGWDWGMGHYNTVYFFTKALIKNTGGTYKTKIVCFKEIVERNKTDVEMADLFAAASKAPWLPKLCEACTTRNAGYCPHPTLKIRAIYFSWEKFKRQMEAQAPAAQFSKLLQARGLPPVSPASTDRVSGASCIYNALKKGELVFTPNCKEIIKALPGLATDPDNLNDVFKPEGLNKADDCYDGFRYGMFGQFSTKGKSQAQLQQEQTSSIQDPFVRALTKYKQTRNNDQRAKSIGTKPAPWMDK